MTGTGATAALEQLFRHPRRLRLAAARPGDLLYGKLVADGEPLDEVIVEISDAPDRETLVVNCHGGAVAARRVLDALVKAGAQEVEPAAILACRESSHALSAVQRESADLLPCAPTLRAAGVLLTQYHGALDAAVAAARRTLERAADPDAAAAAVSRLLATARFGQGLCNPLRVVVAGRPNVGKSTLMNALLRFERVLVHPSPGTTRDVVEDLFAVHGVPFRLVDTAGIRRGENEIEREGVARGVSELARADLALLTFDGSMPLQPEDEKTLAQPLPRRIIPVANKTDLPQRLALDALARRLGSAPALVSATQGTGIRQLEERILTATYGDLPAEGEAVVFTARQADLLTRAQAALRASAPARAAALLQEVSLRTSPP